MQRKVDVAVKGVPFRADAAAIERGRYLFASRGCVDCHGAKGNGAMFVDDGKGLRIAGPNISPGPGNVVTGYTPADWERAIRHGVDPKGRPLMVMPSEDYNRFTDDDLASLVAYLRQMAPESGGGPVLELPLPVRVLYGFGMIRDAAEKIDHARPPEQPVPDGVTTTHGAYVANMCLGCHGAKLNGGRIPGGPPDEPHARRRLRDAALPRRGRVCAPLQDRQSAGWHAGEGDALRFATRDERHRRARAVPVPEDVAAHAARLKRLAHSIHGSTIDAIAPRSPS